MAKKTVSKGLSVKEQALEFANLPKADRREAYKDLPYDVQMEARRIIESKRGVRHVNGRLELTDTELKKQIDHLTEKKENFISGVEVLDKKIAEYEQELAGRN